MVYAASKAKAGAGRVIGHVGALTASFKRHECTDYCKYHIHGLEVVQEFDDYGNHRIKVHSTYSHWVHYQAIAQVELGEGYVAATSDYWCGSLPRCFLYVK